MQIMYQAPSIKSQGYCHIPDIADARDVIRARRGLRISKPSKSAKLKERGIRIQQQCDPISCYASVSILDYDRGQLDIRNSWPRLWCLRNEASFPSALTCFNPSSNSSSIGFQFSLLAWNCSLPRLSFERSAGYEDSIAILRQKLECNSRR